MIVRPMIGEWEVPRLERVGTVEERRLARLSVPGLAGEVHHDLGRMSVAVEIVGSLHGDEERDDFLEKVRDPFTAGDRLAFVADVLTATELEQVLIVGLELEESNDGAGDSTVVEIPFDVVARRSGARLFALAVVDTTADPLVPSPRFGLLDEAHRFCLVQAGAAIRGLIVS